MSIFLIKRNGVIYPCYQSDIDEVSKLKSNVVYEFTCKRPRNPEHHKKYWALCRLVLNNSERFKTEEQVSDWLKFESRNIDVIGVSKGMTYVKLKSINYQSMDQAEFEQFWESIIDYVCDELQCTREDIKKNLVF